MKFNLSDEISKFLYNKNLMKLNLIVHKFDFEGKTES